MNMAQKRDSKEETEYDGCDSGQKRRRVPDLGSVIVEVMKMNALQKLLSVIEPQLRRVVKEEVEIALAKHLTPMERQCGEKIYPSSSRSLQLMFLNKLSLPIFSGTKIEAVDSVRISLALVDAATGRIASAGPESSMKVEIVVLEGDFDTKEDNWSYEEFMGNIVKEREGKRPLLAGDVFLGLTEGTVALGELSFTDNSSWTRNRKFRLGARVEGGHINGIRIREATSEPFMVKDHRGELYKKHYPPSLIDEVWRLEKIGKDGAFHRRLNKENINTVKDFLTMLDSNALRLRHILGTGMSTKMWEMMVEHARTCVFGPDVYTSGLDQGPGTGLGFDVSDEQKEDTYTCWDDTADRDGGTGACNSSHTSSSSVSFSPRLADPFDPDNLFSSAIDAFSHPQDHLFPSTLLFGDEHLDFLEPCPPAHLGNVNSRWKMLISVLKWRFSIKRIVSLRRKLHQEGRCVAQTRLEDVAGTLPPCSF
ncbi:calmodulin-binding protein 60 B-like [Wolffia australiana]